MVTTNQTDPPPKRRPPRILAIGGGKGGVGKSLVSVSLALNLARLGKRCILVDADLGGANLHTLLGLSLPRLSLSSLIHREVPALADTVVPTNRSGLGLICGTQSLSGSANITHAQKQKIIRHLTLLDTDLVVVDLGAGSSFNVVDFFLAADDPLVVMTPLPTSIENSYHFLKSGFFRRLRQATVKEGISELTERLLADRGKFGIRTPRDLINQLQREVPQHSERIRQAMAALQPRLILNQLRHDDDAVLCRQIAAVCRDYFGVNAEHLGTIRNDDRIATSIQMRRPFLETHPHSSFSAAINDIAQHFL